MVRGVTDAFSIRLHKAQVFIGSHHTVGVEITFDQISEASGVVNAVLWEGDEVGVVNANGLSRRS